MDTTFDINKIDPTMAMAIEIMNRLKNINIKRRLHKLREELKNHESNNLDTMEIINNIQFLHKMKDEKITDEKNLYCVWDINIS